MNEWTLAIEALAMAATNPSGAGGPQSTATIDEVRDWFRTEDPVWLDQNAIADIKARLQANDPSVWSQPIEVAEIDGLTYVFNGHHRLTAAVEAGYTGDIPIKKIQPPKDFDVGDHFGQFGD